MTLCVRKKSDTLKLVLGLTDNIDVNAQNKDGDTALLHCCSINNSILCADILLNDRRCDRTIVNHDGHTAESLARSRGCHILADHIAAAAAAADDASNAQQRQ